MATPGKPLDEQTKREIERLRSVVGLSLRETARAQNVSVPTVQKVMKRA